MSTDFDTIKNSNVLTITQGSDFSATVTMTQTSGGAALNLSGYTITGQVRTLDGALACAITIDNSVPTTGVITMSISDTLSALLVPDVIVNHVWGIDLVQPGGNKLPEIQGGLLVKKGVVE